MLYQQDYPDTAMSGSVGSYGSTPQNTPQPQQWRRGYMAEAKLASWPCAPCLGSDRLCAAGGDL